MQKWTALTGRYKTKWKTFQRYKWDLYWRFTYDKEVKEQFTVFCTEGSDIYVPFHNWKNWVNTIVHKLGNWPQNIDTLKSKSSKKYTTVFIETKFVSLLASRSKDTRIVAYVSLPAKTL